MEKKNIVAFLFVSLALLIVVMLIESGITGMSVAEFSNTTSGASMFSGILLFAFILGILVFVESGSLDEIVDRTDEKAIAEGKGIPLEERRAQLSRELAYSLQKSLDRENPPEYKRENDSNYQAKMEDKSRLIKEEIEERKSKEPSKEKGNSKYRK
jgi:hypothetical protein